ncbi:hypothetical protein [Desulfobacula phenolica]|uniref:Uncharacterized protein n=1 Tax=Desulfobacula phenolica TaxID=90732 RepID=A0A1H2JVY3_9BACT|nr:hypothetical protein [Desulfobacula phenolica]SDU60587.1 hypothetical protein SAMN04487931_11647 [Desulfobacula phenolica]
MKKIFYAICLIALIASPVYAAQSGSSSGSITLDDSVGAGPGITGIAISANSYANYSGAATAGGYAGSAGQIMSACAASLKADKDIALYFAVRSSMDPLDTDDNGVYQKAAAGTAIATGTVDGYLVGTNFSGSWMLRGGSQ